MILQSSFMPAIHAESEPFRQTAVSKTGLSDGSWVAVITTVLRKLGQKYRFLLTTLLRVVPPDSSSGPPGEGASQFGNLCSTLSTFSEAEFVTYVTFVTCTENHYNTSHVDIIFITNCLAFCNDMRSKSQHRNRVIRWIPSDSLNIFCKFCTPWTFATT